MSRDPVFYMQLPVRSVATILINNEPILTSTLAVCILQDTLAGEAGEGKGGEE